MTPIYNRKYKRLGTSADLPLTKGHAFYFLSVCVAFITVDPILALVKAHSFTFFILPFPLPSFSKQVLKKSRGGGVGEERRDAWWITREQILQQMVFFPFSSSNLFVCFFSS